MAPIATTATNLATAHYNPGASDFAAVELAVGSFEDAVTHDEPDRLAEVVFPFWHGKRLARDGRIRTETCADVIARRRENDVATAGAGHLSSIQLCFGDFAIARVDRWSDRATSFHLLFKQQGIWRIAGTAATDAAAGRHDSEYAARSEETAVLAVLADYYRAVTTGDRQTIERIFAPVWEMKNHEKGHVVVEDKRAFAARIDGKPTLAYDTDRQIADIQLVADRLAYVRIDKPSVPVSTVFMLVKCDGEWTIIDKAWSAGNKS